MIGDAACVTTEHLLGLRVPIVATCAVTNVAHGHGLSRLIVVVVELLVGRLRPNDDFLVAASFIHLFFQH